MEARLTKEEYQEIRDKNLLNFRVCWEYWCDTKPANYPDLELEEFNQKFKDFLTQYEGMTVATTSGPKFIQFERIQAITFNYYDNIYKNETIQE